VTQFALVTLPSTLLVAVLLPVVAVVLTTRLAMTDSIVAIKVTDLWTAMALGFVVAFIGYQRFVAWLEHLVSRDEPGPAEQGAGQAVEMRASAVVE
jgi:hypothetical protein